MSNFLKITSLALATLAITSCSRESESLSDPTPVQAASIKKAKASEAQTRIVAQVPLVAYYSSIDKRHYYTAGNIPLPSYFKERTLGYLNKELTFGQPYVTIWYNESKGDSYITPYADELKGVSGWSKMEMLGGTSESYPSPDNSTVAVHEYYNSSKSSHFYTTSFAELGYGANGYTYNGIRFYVNYYP